MRFYQKWEKSLQKWEYILQCNIILYRLQYAMTLLVFKVALKKIGVGIMYKDISFFVAVAENESIEKAACSLGISSTVLLRKIAKLEGKLKVRLIKPGYEYISLTMVGLNVYNSFKNVDVEIRGLLNQPLHN